MEEKIDTSQRVAVNNCDHEEEKKETVNENYLQPPNIQETVINKYFWKLWLIFLIFNLGPISSLTSHIYN